MDNWESWFSYLNKKRKFFQNAFCIYQKSDDHFSINDNGLSPMSPHQKPIPNFGNV